MRKVRSLRGVCAECGKDVAVTWDGYVAGGRKHLHPQTGQPCPGHGRKALGQDGKGVS